MRLMGPSHIFAVPKVAPTARMGRSRSPLQFGMNPCGIGSQSSSCGLCWPRQRSQGARGDYSSKLISQEVLRAGFPQDTLAGSPEAKGVATVMGHCTMPAVGHGCWTTFPVFSLSVHPRNTPGLGSDPPLCALLPPGTPSRDVLLVSAIITVSLSVTIVLCGICQWCQRKMVSARPASRPPSPASRRASRAADQGGNFPLPG